MPRTVVDGGNKSRHCMVPTSENDVHVFCWILSRPGFRGYGLLGGLLLLLLCFLSINMHHFWPEPEVLFTPASVCQQK